MLIENKYLLISQSITNKTPTTKSYELKTASIFLNKQTSTQDTLHKHFLMILF